MKCRIDKRGKQVFTPQNERSKLFDKLHNITGDFQKALDVFGITETSGFKEFKNRLRPVSKLNSTDPIVFQSVLERLQQSGLSDNIFQLNTEQLNQKLIELGVSAEVRNQIQVWHGSPHLFQKFSTQFMGTGEGMQAFGWGLYFTDLESIARNYAAMNSTKVDSDVENYLRTTGDYIHLESLTNSTVSIEYVMNERRGSLEQNLDDYGLSVKEYIGIMERQLEDNKNFYNNVDPSDSFNTILKQEFEKNLENVEGVLKKIRDKVGSENLYNVTLHKDKTPDQYTWLEWDRPIDKKMIGDRFVDKLTDKQIDIVVGHLGVKNQSGEMLYEGLSKALGSPKTASLFLLENGIDGIKYPAESISRGATSDNARGFNYVVFDENAVTIEETIQFQKEGITLVPNGFVITEDGKRNIYLNSDNLNLDTLLHENGHLFLDTLKQRFSEHYQAGLELLTKNSVEAQPYIDYVNATQPNLKPHSEAWKEEVLAQIIGNKGEQLIKSRKKNTIKQWLEDLWSFIGEQFGLTSYTPSEIAEMTLEEFAEAVNVEMLNGSSQAIQRNNGNPLNLAPNGKPSILYQSYKDLGYSDSEAEILTAQVYSDEFMSWFGDWVNEPQNASKVVDENGQPLLVLHGTRSNSITVFDRSKNIGRDSGLREYFDYFTTNKKLAEKYATKLLSAEYLKIKDKKIKDLTEELLLTRNNRDFDRISESIDVLKNESRPTIYKVFLNIRKPFTFDGEGLDSSNGFNKGRLDLGYKTVKGRADLTEAVSGNNTAYKSPYDGMIITNIADMEVGIFGTSNEAEIKEKSKDFVGEVFASIAPNQIKSATDNVGTFSEQSADIRYQVPGEQGAQNLNQVLKAFNEGVEAVAKLANEYKKEFGIDSVQHNKVDKLFPTVSKMISEAYEQAETGMTTEEVKEAYKALEEETLQQYKFIVDKGLKVSRWTGEGEPYPNSKSMLKDVRENNHLYFLPNSEAFGKEGDEVDGRAGLKMTDVYLEDGYRMTLSEVFRVVHDYFGHGILGNQFGAVGEENATLQHLDLYSFKALPAVIFQTRGQNSWVNFSGVNDEALRKIKEGSKTNNKSLLEEGQKEFKFATPKDNILPKIFNFKTYETARRINEQEEIRKSETYLDPRGTYEDSYISELLPRITSRNSGKLNGFSRRSLGVSKRLGGYDVDVIAEYEGNQEVENLIKNVFPQFKGTQKIYEISNGEVYRELMIKALETNKFKSSVTVHSAEDFSNMRLFVTEDGSTGITLTKDGFLGGAFGNPKADRPNNLAQMMLLGIKEGAITAEAFATILPDYYSLFGFKAVSRTAFNEEYRPLKENGALEDWDYDTYSKFNNGRPDVVFFIYDGGDRGSIQNRIGQFDDYKNYQKHFTEYYDKDSYDDAYRFMEVEAINKNNYQNQEVNATENTGTIDSANPDIGSQIDYQNFQNNNLRSHMFIENNSKLGSIRTKPTQRGEKVDSAIVYEAYRGQGVGTELYLETVRNLMVEGKILESDNSQTAPAKRIWEKLVEWGLAIKTGKSNFESVPAPSWMTAETTIDEVINNQPIDRSEPSLQELMTYINFQGNTNVTKTEVIELMQANEILDSHELLERLSRAEEQGIFIFTLERLKQTGLFENYEAHKILESKERQGKIKDTLKWLRQNDNFEIQPTQLEKGGSLLSTGKIERQAEESEVTVQDLEGNQIKSNVRLSETITFDYNETLSNNIAFLNQIVRETTWDNLSSQVKDILNSIEVSALDNGIDLRGLPEKYHSATREDILGFLNSLESTLEGNVGPQEFEASRNEFLNFDSITENKEVSRTEVVLGDRLEADVALRDYNLLKVATDVYKRVPNITYSELLQAEANRRGVETEVLNREVNENFDRSLEDVEQAKLIYLLNSNLNTQETKIQPNLSKLDTFQGNFDYIVEQFPKDFGKWVIETNNNYFKLDWRGITLTNPNQSELAFESVPDYFKEDLLEYSKLSKYLNFNREFDLVYDLDSLQVERDRVINNAQALEEYKGDYVTLKNGEGIMIRNGQGQFIKLNGLVFEQVDEHNNLVFYKPLPRLNEDSLMEIEIPKPMLESNVFDYTLYQTQAKEIENLNRETNRTDYEC